MTASASALNSDALYEFLEDLRAQGFVVGTDQVLAAADIVATAPLRYGRILDFGEYRTLLAPIFSGSGEDQQAFYRLFDSWLAGQRPQPRPAQPVAARQPSSPPRRIEQLMGAAPPWPYLVGSLIALLVLFVVVFSSDFFEAFTAEEQGLQQEFSSIQSELDPPRPSLPEEEPAAEPLPALPGEPEIILEGEQRLAVGAQATDSLVHALRISLVALPPLLALAWWAWRQRRLQVWLRRRFTAGSPSLRTLGIQEAGLPLFQDKEYRVAFQKLRRHGLRRTRTPDIDKTVERSLRRGGYFTPVYRARRLHPEYLVLVDQVDYRDQQAALVGELARRLRQEGVLVQVGYFCGDPRFVYLERRGRRRVDLATLRKHHQDNRLVLVSDAAGLFHPASGLPRPWVDVLESWETRVIFSPAPPEEWGYRERQLHELGYWLFPLDRAGLSAAAEYLAQQGEQEQTRDIGTPILRPLAAGPPFPPAISEDGEAWLEQLPPANARLGEMIAEVRAYLGARAFRVLAASAIYPQLDWSLTRFLDETFSRAHAGVESAEVRLLALARLPWFRFGRMPDFLRLYLLNQLSDRERQSVRQALRRLIAGAVEAPTGGGAGLSVAMPEPSRPRRWLRDLIRSEPQHSPYRDYIFARFIVGGRPGPLDFRLPRSVRQVLSPAGSLRERLPWLLGLPAAVLVSMGLWFGFPTFEPALRNLSRPASDLIAEATIPLLNPSLVLRGHDEGLLSADFSPDGTRVITASADGSARLWDAEDGAEIALLGKHAGAVYSAAFSPDGSRVVTTSGDATARLWQTADGSEIAVLEGHVDRVNTAAFSPDGALIVTTSDDATARLWDTASGAPTAILRGHERAVTTAEFSRGGLWVVTGAGDQTARVWETASGNEVAVLRGHLGAVTSAAFSPDGKTVITASEDWTARMWDAASGAETGRLSGHRGVVTSASFSPDGSLAVTAAWDRTARLWDGGSGAEIAVFRGHEDHVTDASFSPAGQRVVTRSRDGTVRLWRAERGVEIAILRGHKDFVNSVAFSPDGTRVITASLDRTAIIWDLQPSWAVPLATFTAEAFRTRLREEIDNGLVWVVEGDGATALRLAGDGLFQSGSSNVQPEARLLVRKVARALNDHPGQILVTGHTDSVPLRTNRFSSNLELSRARANAVQAIITGIVGEAPVVGAEGRADTEPIASNETAEGRSLNRRVEILVPLPGEDTPIKEDPTEKAVAEGQRIVVEVAQGAFEDARVRQAVITSVDWFDLAQEAGFQPDAIVLRSGDSDAEIEKGSADPDRARRLLAEAGYAGDRTFRPKIFFEASLEKMAEPLASVLQGIGLDSELEMVTPATQGDALASTRAATGRQTIDLPYLRLSYARPPGTQSTEPGEASGSVVLEKSRYLLSQDGIALQNSRLGPFCCTGHVIVVRNSKEEPIGYAYFFAWEGQAYNVAGGSIVPDLVVQVSGLRDLDELSAEQLESEIKFTARDLEPVSPWVRAGALEYRAELVEYSLTRRDDQPYFQMGSLDVRLDVRLAGPVPMPGADLVVVGPLVLDFDGETRRLKVEGRVANVGSAVAEESLLQITDRSGAFGGGSIRIGPLQGRETTGFTIAGLLPEAVEGAQVLLLQATIDPRNEVAESNETNNRSEIVRYTVPAAKLERATPADLGLDLGQFHALVIGNSDYQFLPDRQTSESDAQDIARILRDRYGFDWTLLLNATRYEILSAVNDLRARLSGRDSVVIFYAGHSEIDRETSRVFWLPVDAEPDNRINWLSTVDLVDAIGAFRARHVLVIADAAFSGTLTRSILRRPDPSQGPEARTAWLASLARERSRTVLASRGLDPVVLDGAGRPNSLFAGALLEVLSRNREILPAQDLSRLVAQVTLSRGASGVEVTQVPEYAPLQSAGHNGGEFLFVPTEVLRQPSAVRAVAPPTSKADMPAIKTLK